MIDTNSPAYLAGLAAGRRSFRLFLTSTISGHAFPLVEASELPALAGVHRFAHLTLRIVDTMPEAETYPDRD